MVSIYKGRLKNELTPISGCFSFSDDLLSFVLAKLATARFSETRCARFSETRFARFSETRFARFSETRFARFQTTF